MTSMEKTEVEVFAWRDRKRYLWLMGLIAPTALFVMLPIVWGLNQLGWGIAATIPFWIGPILLYVLLPSLDLKFGPDGQNPPDEVMEKLENDKYYRYCTYAYIPFQYASVIFGAYLFTAKDLSWLGFDGSLNWVTKIGLALSVGVLGGIGINTAHELGHKKDNLERWLSKITLAQVCYGHFYVEHNRGHHVRVATPEDPASARFGLARLRMAQQRWTDAMDELLEILMRDKTWNSDLARKTFIAILEIIDVPKPKVADGQIPPEDPTVATYRRRLSSVVLS